VKKSEVRVGSAQPKSQVIDYRLTAAEVLAQVDKSLEALVRIVQKAGDAGCDVLALPEDTLGLVRWEAGNPSRLEEVLPEAVERMLSRLGQAAAARRMYLLCCSDLVEKDGALYNTAFLLGRDGKEIGRYHKVNMPIHELNKRRGHGFPVFKTPDLGDVGLLICYDMVFPEAARCLALGGADIIFHLTLGGAAFGDDDISRVAFRTRAAENFVYVVVSQRGNGSMIISPRGKVVAEGERADDIVIADINPFGGRHGGDSMNWQEDMRSRLFRERHPAAFSLLTHPDPPVLSKIPATMEIEEAVRISQGALTKGEENFAEADKLVREGRDAEAIRAFEKLRSDYPYTWIDRVARERLEKLKGAEKE
jgi:predicted amidohydrolase